MKWTRKKFIDEIDKLMKPPEKTIGDIGAMRRQAQQSMNQMVSPLTPQPPQVK
jgi:hypothetical protein